MSFRILSFFPIPDTIIWFIKNSAEPRMMSKSKRILQEGFCTVKTRKSRQHNLSVELEAAYPGGKQKTSKKNKQDVASTLLSLKLSTKKKYEETSEPAYNKRAQQL